MEGQTMMARMMSGLALIAAVVLLTFGSGVRAASHEQGEHDMHAGHDMSGHSAERDVEGRRLYGMKHNVSPEQAAEMRERIIGWEDISDAEIALSMTQMGSNYEWYISPEGVAGDTGVLILLHGFRERGDKIFKEQVQPYGDIFPMAMSFGMSMMMSDHIQLALDDLVAAGAKQIVVIPMVASEHNSMIRQWQYIFGLYDEPSYATVQQVSTPARVYFAEPPGGDPAVAEILVDHALELSTNPENEVVIIAAHGPSDNTDNDKELTVLEDLAAIVQEDGGFAAVYGTTLQDDAPLEVRDANVAKLRGLVEDVVAEGQEVIIVTNLMGSRTIQAKLRKDLKGLDYKFNAKGMVAHNKFVSWIGETVRMAIERDMWAQQANAAMN
jgi:sirohydrochlorin ferrochelatase